MTYNVSSGALNSTHSLTPGTVQNVLERVSERLLTISLGISQPNCIWHSATVHTLSVLNSFTKNLLTVKSRKSFRPALRTANACCCCVQNRKLFAYKESVRWNELASVLSTLFLNNTGRGLTQEQLDYLARLIS